jgi:hypothetical protein
MAPQNIFRDNYAQNSDKSAKITHLRTFLQNKTSLLILKFISKALVDKVLALLRNDGRLIAREVSDFFVKQGGIKHLL